MPKTAPLSNIKNILVACLKNLPDQDDFVRIQVALPNFYFGNCASCDVAPIELKLRGQGILGDVPLFPDSPDVISDFYFNCFVHGQIGLAVMMVLCLAACSKKEEPAVPEKPAASAEAKAPATSSENKASAPCSYDLSGQENLTVENLVFDEDVTVTGENGKITFLNCAFNGNIINKGGEGARVCLWQDCTFADSSECILDPALEEATMDTDLPKFMIFCTMPNVSCEKLGAVISSAEQAIRLNGEEHPIEAAEFHINETTGEFIPYSGQEANAHNVAKWIEGGEAVQMHVAVFAAE